MAERLTVTAGDLDACAVRCTSGGASIGRELHTLMNEVRTLTSGTWQGQASAAFAGYYEQLNTGWAQVEQALEQIAQQLRATGSGFTDTDRQLGRQFA